MKSDVYNLAREMRLAKSLYGDVPKPVLRALKYLIQRNQILVTNGDVKFFDKGWYVTHSGLLAPRRASPMCRHPLPPGTGVKRSGEVALGVPS